MIMVFKGGEGLRSDSIGDLDTGDYVGLKRCSLLYSRSLTWISRDLASMRSDTK